jgi:hypothetical protein
MTATNKNIPGKRIKTLHRKSTGQPLRSFARFLAQEQNEDVMSRNAARAWLKGKGARP